MANNDNIIYAKFNHGREITTDSRSQYAYGQVLKISGLHLPASFDADISNKGDKQAKVVVGTDNELPIDDAFFLSGKDVIVMINVHAADKDGRTKYIIRIPVEKRPERADIEVEPVEQDAISVAIATLNEAVEQTSANAESAENSANRAHESATNAQSSASIATQKATEASTSANIATIKANEASISATNAQNSANNAQQSATSAQESANSASASASRALVNAEKTQSDKEIVELAKSNVLSAVGEVRTYATTAQSASQAIQDMNVQAITLEVDSDVTVEKSVDPVTGAVTLTYGIPKGVKGEKGDAFIYSDFTPEQLASLKGEKGDKGDTGNTGAKGDTGNSGVYIGTTEPIDEDIKIWIDSDGDPDDIVTDVKINGSSVVINGVANIPVGNGIKITNGAVSINPATSARIKQGVGDYNPVVSATQHTSTFYGLAKASGDTTQSQSDNAVGTYTDEAKTAIKTMLGVEDPVVDDVQINGTSIVQNGVANVPIGTGNHLGVVQGWTGGGTQILSDGRIGIANPSVSEIKAGSINYKPIPPSNQHTSTFYGLAKAAGDTTQSASSNAIGTYTDEAKSAIQTMLDVPSKNDIPEVNVDDVQIDGTSIVENGVANVPMAGANSAGVVKVSTSVSNGVYINNSGELSLYNAPTSIVKGGTDNRMPIVAKNQHASAFYGLAKAAGDTTQSLSSNTVGTYTDDAKTAIQTMLGVPSEDDVVEDVQINGTSIVTDGAANIPMANSGIAGAVKINPNFGIGIFNGELMLNAASSSDIKQANNSTKAISAYRQHESTFYGLAKAAGDTTQSQSDNAVGTYTDDAKEAIQTMLDVPSNSDVVTDVQVDGTSILSNGVANIPPARTNQLGLVKVSTGLGINVNNNNLYVVLASERHVKEGTFQYSSLTPSIQHQSVFYGLAKAAGDTTQSSSANEVGTYTEEAKQAIQSMIGINYPVTDVQIDGTSVINNGVANVPLASTNVSGVVKLGYNTSGLYVDSERQLRIYQAQSPDIKTGTQSSRPITPTVQHISTFYGLAKAAGDSTQSASNNAVGAYTDEAKTAIKQMLDIKDDYDSLVVEVSGTDPVITGKPSYRYNCGELYTLSITPPESGTMDIIFTSGTTPTVLTLPNTVKMPDWWAGIETNTTYEMCITDGTYCGVMSWAT